MLLNLPPDQASYVVTDGKEVVYNQLEGGFGRYRRDILNSNSLVDLQWTVNRGGLDYLTDFFENITNSGSLPFTIFLYIDSGIALTEQTAYFVPETFKISEGNGFSFIVSAQLEIKPLEINEDEAFDYITVCNEFGFDWYFMDLFDYIINTKLKLDFSA
jgi:hypothetical protein